jgi:polyisoprenoid-binding protein YceI
MTHHQLTWRYSDDHCFRPALTELTGTYTLDPAHTRIGFVARHAMVTKVRGSFDEFAGTAVLDGTNPANSPRRGDD